MVCHCGKTHAECVTRLLTGCGAAKRLGGWLREDGISSVLCVADMHTLPYAHALMSLLDSVNTALFVYGDESLIPDEQAVGKLLIAAGPLTDAIIAVGSGTLNDLARYVSYRLHKPYYIVATAASMDGYTSSVAPLIVNGLKETFPAHAPLGVVGDPAFINTAPRLMTAAGYGDMAGKWTSLNDWELEHIVSGGDTGGDFCESLAHEMRKTAEALTGLVMKTAPEPADGLAHAPALPEAVLKALLDSGLVMQKAGHSKPASGGEHHLSHFWEMMCLMRGKTPALHGVKVGLAALVSAKASEWLLSGFCDDLTGKPSDSTSTIDWERAYHLADTFDRNKWQATIRGIYGRAAEGVLSLWPDENAQTRRERIDTILARRDLIAAALRQNIPAYAYIEAGLKRMGCPVSPQAVPISREDFYNGILHAHWIRKRFTVWKLAEALGLLPEYAVKLTKSFFHEM